MSGWHRHHRGQSIGRILHFIEAYCGFDVMEHCTVGSDSVHYYGEKIATYEWLPGYEDIPVFEFLPVKSYSGEDLSIARKKNQKEKLLEALMASENLPEKEPCENCRKLRLRLAIVHKDDCKDLKEE